MVTIDPAEVRSALADALISSVIISSVAPKYAPTKAGVSGHAGEATDQDARDLDVAFADFS